ncbi:MAG: hypothetical protein V1494_02210 [Candidatus Diapherotrites archaeon]
MDSHDSVTAERQKELLERISPKFGDLSLDLQELMQQSKDPMVVSALLFRLVQERERTNKILDSINDKYDRIMLELKTGSGLTDNNFAQSQKIGAAAVGLNKFEVLPEQDQIIMKLIEERGSATAKEVMSVLNYRGLNAGSQRLNKLFKEGHLKKVQAGKKVLYLIR